MQGLGGGSATGVLFRSLVFEVARPAESSRRDHRKSCRFLRFFLLFLVQFLQVPGTLCLHFLPKPVQKWGYPYFDSIPLFGERPIFSGAQNVESNFRCHNENLSRHFGHQKKLGIRRTAKSNQNRGTPSLGRVLEGRGVCHSPSDKLPPTFWPPKKTRRTFEKLGALSHKTSYFRVFRTKKSSSRSPLLR